MTSTIQLSNKVKETLALYKISTRDSYEDVIVRLIEEKKRKARYDEEMIKKACLITAGDDLQICKELSGVDLDGDSEWVWEK